MADRFEAVSKDKEVKELDNVQVKRIGEGKDEHEILTLAILHNRSKKLAERITESEERIADYKGYIKTYGSYLQPVRRIAKGVKLKK